MVPHLLTSPSLACSSPFGSVLVEVDLVAEAEGDSLRFAADADEALDLAVGLLLDAQVGQRILACNRARALVRIAWCSLIRTNEGEAVPNMLRA